MAEEKSCSKVVFMGTPDFAVGVLDALLSFDTVQVCAVYTQPDRPAGRGNKLVPPPVKTRALSCGIPCYQPASFKSPEEQERLAAMKPDFLVVAAYGMLLPQAVLDIPRLAPINVHTSKLPDYRGSAPVQRAIMDGREVTGISIMRMEAGLDTGPVYECLDVPVGRETSGSLLAKMAELAGPLLGRVMASLENGTAVEHPQVGPSTYAAKLQKSEGFFSWNAPALELDCRIRGLTPDPGAHAVLLLGGDKKSVVVIEEAIPIQETSRHEPGTLLAKKGELRICCSNGELSVRRLRPQGKKSMDIAAFLNGMRIAGPKLDVVGRVE